MNKVQLINMLGLPASATDAEVEQAVSQAYAGSQQVTKLTNELAAEKQRGSKERAETLVDNAIKQKKVTPGQRENLVNMATNNYDGAKALLDSLTGAPAMASEVVVADAETNPSNPEGTGGQADRSKWTLKDYMDKAPADLQNMAEKEPAKYSTLVQNAFPHLKKHLVQQR